MSKLKILKMLISVNLFTQSYTTKPFYLVATKEIIVGGKECYTVSPHSGKCQYYKPLKDCFNGGELKCGMKISEKPQPGKEKNSTSEPDKEQSEIKKCILQSMENLWHIWEERALELNMPNIKPTFADWFDILREEWEQEKDDPSKYRLQSFYTRDNREFRRYDNHIFYKGRTYSVQLMTDLPHRLMQLALDLKPNATIVSKLLSVTRVCDTIHQITYIQYLAALKKKEAEFTQILNKYGKNRRDVAEQEISAIVNQLRERHEQDSAAKHKEILDALIKYMTKHDMNVGEYLSFPNLGLIDHNQIMIPDFKIVLFEKSTPHSQSQQRILIKLDKVGSEIFEPIKTMSCSMFYIVGTTSPFTEDVELFYEYLRYSIEFALLKNEETAVSNWFDQQEKWTMSSNGKMTTRTIETRNENGSLTQFVCHKK